MKVLKSIASVLSSLRVTVVLLSLALLLIFAGTLAQREDGIWQVVNDYFRCWITFIPFKHLVPFVNPDIIPGKFLFPGGYSIIIALLVNLIAAHSLRFKFVLGDLLLLPLLVISLPVVWITQNNPSAFNIILASLVGIIAMVLVCVLHKKRAGVIIIHFSIILLLVGEGVTGYLAKEGQMPITEGQASNWVQDIRSVELAIVDPSDPARDRQIVISGDRLAESGTIRDESLPFDLRVDRFHWNADPLGPQMPGAQGNMLATVGPGKGVAIVGKPRVSGIDPDEVDVTGAFVTPIDKSGKELGTYLVTLPMWAPEGMLEKLNHPQPVEAGGKTYQMQMRFERSYRPFTIHLHNFTHDKFEGTILARNYASHVTLSDPANGVNREVTIRMNEPLRYAGETYFQASFRGDKTTILQVVQNPGWLMPYIACTLGALGLLIHFGIHLVSFLSKRSKTGVTPVVAPTPAPAKPRKGEKVTPAGPYSLEPAGGWPMASKLVPAALALFAIVYIIGHAFQRDYQSKQSPPAQINLSAFARLPVSFDGRVMPIDSAARGNLKILSSRETTKGGWDTETDKDDGESKVQAVEWLADTLAGNQRSDTYKIFRLDHPELKSLLGLKVEEKLFSWNDLTSKPGNMSKLQEQVSQVSKVPAKQRDAYQEAVSKLYQHISRYLRLVNATEQGVLYDILADERKGVELLVEALRAGVFLAPNQRSEDQHKAIFSNQLLRQLDRTVNYLGSGDGRTDNLLFIAPLDEGQKWQPLARVTVQQLRKTVKDVRNVLMHAPDQQDIVTHLDSVETLLAEREQTLGEGSEMPASQMESATAWFTMLRQLRNNDAAGFDSTVASYARAIDARAPDSAQATTGFEVSFNRFDPFTVSLVFYIGVLVLSLASFIGFTRPFWRSAVMLLVIAILVHAYGLIARMVISGRPPVTNLYSSAIFIGFGVAVFALILEAIYKNGVGALTAAIIGIATTLIAGALDIRDADTMGQLQAVLDTNFWLATHVVIITLGYSAAFMAGIVAVVFIIRGLFSTDLDSLQRKEHYRMAYGIVCFAMFASFVGTILGGIWADQSWGRFWGWDPKENGAILIVLWNAIILHARWGGLVKERGFMVLCVIGIHITAWSWFGTNLMGIGLHAYGFIDGGVLALVLSWVGFGIIAGAGMLPASIWRSYRYEASLPTARGVPPKLPR